MAWFILSHLVSTVLEWFRIGRLSEPEKDLEILLLRPLCWLLNPVWWKNLVHEQNTGYSRLSGGK